MALFRWETIHVLFYCIHVVDSLLCSQLRSVLLLYNYKVIYSGQFVPFGFSTKRLYTQDYWFLFVFQLKDYILRIVRSFFCKER